MKIAIEIPDEEIREEVKSYVGRKLAERLYEEYTSEEHAFRVTVRKVAREILRMEIHDNLDRYAQMAVDAAADSIARKAKIVMSDYGKNG